MAWAACGLFPLPCSYQNKWVSLRCKDFSGFFELIVLGYVKWIFLLSITVSLYWAENWKRVAGSYPSPFFLRALKQISTKWSSSDAGKLSIFSFFIPLASMQRRTVFISVAVFLFVFALFCWLIKSSMASWLSVMPVSVSTSKVSRSLGWYWTCSENGRLLHPSLKSQ